MLTIQKKKKKPTESPSVQSQGRVEHKASTHILGIQGKHV